MEDKRYKAYRRTGVSWMRPYEFGEDMSGISVSKEDEREVSGPGPHGMIAINADNPNDRWYVSRQFCTNYELV